MNFRRLTCPSVGLFLHSGANAARTASLTGPFRQDLFREDLIRKDLIPNGFAFRPRGLGHRCPIDARQPESLWTAVGALGKAFPRAPTRVPAFFLASLFSLTGTLHLLNAVCPRPVQRAVLRQAGPRTGRAGLVAGLRRDGLRRAPMLTRARPGLPLRKRFIAARLFSICAAPDIGFVAELSSSLMGLSTSESPTRPADPAPWAMRSFQEDGSGSWGRTARSQTQAQEAIERRLIEKD